MEQLTYGHRSLAALGIVLLAVQEFHPLVLVALFYGQTAAWLAALLSALLASLLVWPVAVALQRIPGGSLYDLVRIAVGRWGAILYAVLLGAILVFEAGMILRETSEMAVSSIFPHTPQTFATTALLGAGIYVAMGDGLALVRLGQLLLVPVLVSLLVVLAGTIGWGELRYLLPLMGPGPARLLLGTPAVAAFFGPLILLPILAGNVAGRGRLTRWLVAVPAIAGALYAVLKANLVMTFSYTIGSGLAFPLHESTRLIIGGRFFERLEGVWLLVWVMGTSVLLGALLHGGSRIYAQAFGFPRHTLAVPTFATLVLTVAFFPTDQARTIMLHGGVSIVITTITLFVPALLALVAMVRLRAWEA